MVMRTYVLDWMEPHELIEPIVIAAESYQDALDRSALWYEHVMDKDEFIECVYGVVIFEGDVTHLQITRE